MAHTLTERARLFKPAGASGGRHCYPLRHRTFEIPRPMRFALSRRSLADYAAEPENNYQLLRFLAALMVLYGHSYALTALRHQRDLVTRYLGFTYSGAIGVDIF